jgi:hypothetical protein
LRDPVVRQAGLDRAAHRRGSSSTSAPSVPRNWASSRSCPMTGRDPRTSGSLAAADAAAAPSAVSFRPPRRHSQSADVKWLGQGRAERLCVRAGAHDDAGITEAARKGAVAFVLRPSAPRDPYRRRYWPSNSWGSTSRSSPCAIRPTAPLIRCMTRSARRCATCRNI